MRNRNPVNAPLVRRGGARGTGAASGSPPVGYSEPWLLDSREVARLLDISRTKAFAMIGRNELPVIRIGRCVRVSRDGLRAWIHENSSTTRSGQAFEDSRSAL